MKRSVRIANHKTSISLESEFWNELKQIAVQDAVPLNQIIADIDASRTTNLSSALRVFILNRLKRER